MPDCIIEVCNNYTTNTTTYLPNSQEIRRRYPSHDGLYRDYMSTFDASVDYGSVDYGSADVEYGSEDVDYDNEDSMQ